MKQPLGLATGRQRQRWRVLFAGLLLFVAGCDGQSPTPEDPAVVRVGVLPDQTEQVLRQRYADLLAYLSEQVGVAHELYVPDGYADLVDAFGRGEFDLAYFGGVTFVRAREEHDAQPLVMRDVDLRFVSYFVTRSDVTGEKVEDFRGQHLAFGSELSTSGHLMPRYFLRQLDIVPEQFFATIEPRQEGVHLQRCQLQHQDRLQLSTRFFGLNLGLCHFLQTAETRLSFLGQALQRVKAFQSPCQH